MTIPIARDFGGHSFRLAERNLFISHRQNRTYHSICYSSCGVLAITRNSLRSWCDGSSDRSFMVDPLSYFTFQPLFHVWCNKGCGMCYHVCRMVRIKEPLLLTKKSSPCGARQLRACLYHKSDAINP